MIFILLNNVNLRQNFYKGYLVRRFQLWETVLLNYLNLINYLTH